MWEKTIQSKKTTPDTPGGVGYSVFYRFEGSELQAFVRLSGDELEVPAALIYSPAELLTLRSLLEKTRDYVALTLGYTKVP